MSKKRAKQPRKFGRKKAKSNIRVREEGWDRKSRRLDDKAVNFFDELSPGFGAWYRENYDENGRYIGKKIPGLFE